MGLRALVGDRARSELAERVDPRRDLADLPRRRSGGYSVNTGRGPRLARTLPAVVRMKARQIVASLDHALARYGQTVTLQRTAIDGSTGAITVTQEVTCPAKFRTYFPQDLQAGDVQVINVILSPTSLGGFGLPS